MDSGSHDEAPYTYFGHSLGSWDGDALVVDTAHFAEHRRGNVPGGLADSPYLWIDATYPKVREAGRIVSVADVLAFMSFPKLIGRRSTAPIRSSGSTPRSSGAPTSSAASIASARALRLRASAYIDGRVPQVDCLVLDGGRARAGTSPVDF
jgi:hypothetical protein